MRFSDPGVVMLSDARSELHLAPSAGGRLMVWQVDGSDVIRWPAHYDLNHAAKIRGGNPLLFPFLGRHRVGDEANRWQDADGRIHALATHGFARDLPFTATCSGDNRGISMQLASSNATRAGYPFEFVFTAEYRLDGPTLHVTLITENTGTIPLPYYAGHHFYFALPHADRTGSSIHLPETSRCCQLPDGSISPPEREPNTVSPGDPAILDKFHVLKAPHGVVPARLSMPALGRDVVIEMINPDRETSGGTLATWYAVTTWTESDESDFYCVEPWLGLPNAIHHGQGLRWVAPGATERAECRLTVQPSR